MKLPRRQFLHLAAGAAALPAISQIARAQTYPTRPVRWIVGFAPGGGNRHRRSSNGSMAFGAAWSASSSSKIAPARPPISPPRRSFVRPPDGYTLLVVAPFQRDQRDPL